MNKLNTPMNHNSWWVMMSLSWRVGLAIIGSYIAVSLLCAVIPNLLTIFFSISKATAYLWMMLSSFLLYSLFVLWIISSRRLLRTSVQLTGTIVVLWLVIQWCTHAQLIPEIIKDI